MAAACVLVTASCGKSGGGPSSSSAPFEAAASNVLPASTGRAAELGGPGAAADAELSRVASGVRSVVLHTGQGSDHPAVSDRVRVHYTGWSADGGVFDSSLPRGEPSLFTLSQVIPGWAEALEQMVPGEKRKVWVPSNLAYGDHPKWGNPAGDLTYEIELVEIIHSPKRPEDVAGPPPTAIVTQSGLSYRVLRAGAGKVHPRPEDSATVHYSGWTTDGLLFDSTQLRNGPSTFTVGKLIKGWVEALELMVVGDRIRFWMPAKLAYGEHPKDPEAPAGMLVFDIELLDIR